MQIINKFLFPIKKIYNFRKENKEVKIYVRDI